MSSMQLLLRLLFKAFQVHGKYGYAESESDGLTVENSYCFFRDSKISFQHSLWPVLLILPKAPTQEIQHFLQASE